MKRKCLNLDKKIEILNYAAKHPELGCRNLAEHFFCWKDNYCKHFETGQKEPTNYVMENTTY